MAQLFPASHRAIGALMALGGLLCYCVASTEGLINLYRIMLPGRTLPDGSYPYPPNFWQMNMVFGNISLAILVLGVITLFLAKERDEYFSRLRMEATQFAVYAQFVVGLAAFGYFYLAPGYQIVNAFQAILGLVCGTFLVAYIVRYYGSFYFKSPHD